MRRRRLDDVARRARLAASPNSTAAGALHRAAPQLDRRRHPGQRPGHRMDPQVPPDRRVLQAGPLEDGRRPQGPGGDDDLRAWTRSRSDADPAGRRRRRRWASPVSGSGTSARPSTPTARPPSSRTRVTRTRGTIRAPAANAVGQVRPDAGSAWPHADSRTHSSRSRRSRGALRRIGAASQPSAAAPRRMASSFGGW